MGRRDGESETAVKTIRIELVIATLALLASAAASIASIVQTRTIGRELSASVWPYLAVDTTFSPRSIQVAIDNDGLGPAVVRTVHLSADGRAVNRLRDAALDLFPRSHSHVPKHSTANEDFSAIGTGTVIRPGASLMLARVQSPLLHVGPGSVDRFELTICYCSIVNDCWTIDSRDTRPPREARDCPGQPTILSY